MPYRQLQFACFPEGIFNDSGDFKGIVFYFDNSQIVVLIGDHYLGIQVLTAAVYIYLHDDFFFFVNNVVIGEDVTVCTKK